jgi:hypothetical protein
MSQRRIHQWTDVQTTVGAATANLGDSGSPKFTIPSGSGCYVIARFVGRDTTADATTGFEVRATFKNHAGTRTIDGTATAVLNQTGGASLAAASGTLVVQAGGVNIGATATGVGGITIEWFVYVTMIVT